MGSLSTLSQMAKTSAGTPHAMTLSVRVPSMTPLSLQGEQQIRPNKQREVSVKICSRGIVRFEPLAIETTGVYGKTSAKFVAEIGRRIAGRTGDIRETAWLRQRLSIAVVRGNAVSVLATGGSY